MKKFNLSIVCAVIMAIHAIAGGSVQANLITNGGFEDPVNVKGGNDAKSLNFVSYAAHGDSSLTNPLAYNVYEGGLTGWTVTSGSVDVVNYDPSRYGWAAYAPNQSLDLNGWGPGAISQSFATDQGAEYQLTFLYANNPYGTTVSGGPKATVTINGVTDTLAHHTSHLDNSSFAAAQAAMNWTLFSYTFIASSTTTTLAFASTTLGTAGIALDAIDVIMTHPKVIPAPEPTSLALLGMGVVGAAVGAYRRRRSA